MSWTELLAKAKVITVSLRVQLLESGHCIADILMYN